MSKPGSVTVILTSYNLERYLPEAIEHVVSQARRPDKFLIVEDGSTDGSKQIVSDYSIRYPELIECIDFEENRGVQAAVEEAMRRVHTQYVYFLSADDYPESEFLSKSLALLSHHPSAGFCASHPKLLSEETGNFDVKFPANTVFQYPTYVSPDSAEKALADGFWLAGHTCVVDFEKLQMVGGVNWELKWNCDWFYTHVLALRFGFCYVPEALTVMRTRKDTLSGAGKRDVAAQRAILQAMIGLLKSPAYRDVHDAFARARAFAIFPDFLPEVLPKLGTLEALAHLRDHEKQLRLDQIERRRQSRIEFIKRNVPPLVRIVRAFRAVKERLLGWVR